MDGTANNLEGKAKCMRMHSLQESIQEYCDLLPDFSIDWVALREDMLTGSIVNEEKSCNFCFQISIETFPKQAIDDIHLDILVKVKVLPNGPDFFVIDEARAIFGYLLTFVL